jgi:hypothetical protein
MPEVVLVSGGVTPKSRRWRYGKFAVPPAHLADFSPSFRPYLPLVES